MKILHFAALSLFSRKMDFKTMAKFEDFFSQELWSLWVFIIKIQED